MTHRKFRGMCLTLAAFICLGVCSVPVAAMQSPLDPDQIETLQFIVEEEKLARDVYAYYSAGFPELAVFANIKASEDIHLATVREMLDKWSLFDPTRDEYGEDVGAGIFTDEGLRALYDWMTGDPLQIYVVFSDVFTGAEYDPESVIEAMLRVGGLIEEKDILDLDEAIAGVDNDSGNPVAPLLRVYQDLQRGSRNHLRAFERNLDSDGAEYVIILLTQDEFDSIVGGENERGPHRRQ